jgi:hypothetical protein
MGEKMNKTNLFVDLGIFTAFLIVSAPRVTGETIHEWLGVALAVTLLVHILLHWNWIVTVAGKFFQNLWQSSRFNFLVNVLVFAAYIAVTVSGIMISKSVLSTLGIQLAGGGSWKMIHKTAADAALYLTGLHFALHWNWLVTMVKKYILSPVANSFRPGLNAQPVRVEIRNK